MGNKNYIAAAQDIRQEDTVELDLTWAEGDWLAFEINNKIVKITAGPTTNTPARMASGATAVLNAGYHSTNAFTSAGYDITTNIGGQEIGEFRDIVAEVNDGTITLKSIVPGVDFSVAATSSTAGDGSHSHTAEVVSATGREWPDNVDNYSDGVLPAADDVVYIRDSGISIRRGLSTIADGVSWKFCENFNGDFGLPTTNTVHGAGYHYPEYRGTEANVEPSAVGNTLIRITSPLAARSNFYLDFGSNSSTSLKLMTRIGNVWVSGGVNLKVDCSGGNVRLGIDVTKTDVGLLSVVARSEGRIVVGEDCTLYDDVGVLTTIENGQIEVHCAGGGAFSVHNVNGGRMTFMETATARHINVYDEGVLDWRGTAIAICVAHSGGIIDASECEVAVIPSTTLAKGSSLIDPNGVFGDTFTTAGCAIQDVTLDLPIDETYQRTSPAGGLGV